MSMAENGEPELTFTIVATPGKLPYELLVYEDKLVCVSSFRGNRKTFLFSDIKRISLQKDEKGWPRHLSIFLKDDTHERYDLGYSKAGEQILAFIEPRLQ